MKSNIWKLITILGLLTLLIIVLVACAPKPAVESPEPPPVEVKDEPAIAEPITLRVGTTTIWDAISPATGWTSYNLRYLFHDGLIEWTELTSFEPGLAESWTVSDDELVWTFKIHEGLTFHDDTPCTAEDIAWSLNFLMEGMIGPLELYVEGFEEVIALDPTTL